MGGSNMEITTITTYKTKDGRLFTNKDRAEEHEQKLNNKTVHYIVDFANLVVHKAFYLRVNEVCYNGTTDIFRRFIYETESGTEIIDETIHDKAYVIILSEEQYKISNPLIHKMFVDRKSYEDFYASSKFVNPKPKKIPVVCKKEVTL